MNGVLRWQPVLAASAAVVLALGTEVQAERKGKDWLKDFKDPNEHPVTLKRQGYFYVNGRYFTDAEGEHMTGQQYVEFQIPKDVKHPYPVVMIHGGAQTAVNWMATMDGREGWRSFFTVNGYAVYLVDQVGRGRSPAYNPLVPYSPADVVTYGTPFSRPDVLTVERTWTIPEQFMDWPQASAHTQWPGFNQPNAGRPGDPYFDQFFASQIQSRSDPTGTATQRDAQDAGAALLDRIGPAILITHSQSGTEGFLIADRRPDLVKAVVTLEGGWNRGNTALATWGIVAVPITYSPPVTDPSQLTFVPQAPDPTGLLRTCVLQAEPARQLPNLRKMPHLLVVSEAGSIQRHNHCVSKYLAQAGVENEYVNLKDVGIRGNAHMLMIEKNALEIAAFVATWIADHVEKKPKR